MMIMMKQYMIHVSRIPVKYVRIFVVVRWTAAGQKCDAVALHDHANGYLGIWIELSQDMVSWGWWIFGFCDNVDFSLELIVQGQNLSDAVGNLSADQMMLV